MLVCLSLKSCFLSLFKEAPVFEPSSEVWNKHIIFPVHLGQIILHSRFTLDRSYYIPGSPWTDHITFPVHLGQIILHSRFINKPSDRSHHIPGRSTNPWTDLIYTPL